MSRRSIPSAAQVRMWPIPPAQQAPSDQPTPARAPRTDVLHGYTLADLDALTREVLRLDRWNRAGDVDERHAAIWHAIAEHIVVAEQPPGRQELLTAGVKASNAHVKREMKFHGRDPVNIGERMPNYERYWASNPTPSPETRIVERIALSQVLPLLTKRQAEALTALAAYEDYSTAATAIGSTYATYTTLVTQARRRIYKAWHQGETPPTKPWRKDIRESKPLDTRGNKRLTVSEVDALRARYNAGEKLRAGALDAGVPVSTLSALIRGTRTPAPDPAGA
jgi:hypothetical protein